MLKKLKPWKDAAIQIFYSLSVGLGGLTSLARHNYFDNNCLRASVIVCISNCLTSVFIGFVMFPVLGFKAHITDMTIEKMLKSGRVKGGSELAFTAFPLALSFASVPQLWSCLFFLMMIIVGMPVVIVTIETIATALEENVSCVSHGNRRPVVVVVICVVSFLLGLPMTTRGGKDILDLLNGPSLSWNVLLVALLEVLTVAWMYGAHKFWANVEEMGTPRLPQLKWYWIICWQFITPFVLTMMVIFSLVDSATNLQEGYNGIITWLVTITSVSIIPAFAIHEIIKRRKSGKELGFALFRQTSSW